jgi:thiosulfate reductase/polysulfide reductase chain A
VAKVDLHITRRQFLASSLTGSVLMGSQVPGFASKYPEPAWFTRGDVVTTYNYCDMCPWKCGIVVESVDGRVIKIDGNPSDPKSRGMLCARGQAGVSFMNDPDRLRSPMIRTGERGEGKFREVTWEEAFDYTAEKLLAIKDRYGPEGLAIFGHTTGDSWFAEYFAQAWGTPNAGKPSTSICLSPRDEAAKLTLGFPAGGHEPMDWDEMECITLIGSHIGEDSRNTVMQDFISAHNRGAQVIVVDPRFSSAAAKADYWLPIKPGTDTALLLAWINVLIAENLYDDAYLDEWANGLDELTLHVAEYTPEWAAAITDLPAGQIRETARVMGWRHPRTAIMPGRHTVVTRPGTGMTPNGCVRCSSSTRCSVPTDATVACISTSRLFSTHTPTRRSRLQGVLVAVRPNLGMSPMNSPSAPRARHAPMVRATHSWLVRQQSRSSWTR